MRIDEFFLMINMRDLLLHNSVEFQMTDHKLSIELIIVEIKLK